MFYLVLGLFISQFLNWIFLQRLYYHLNNNNKCFFIVNDSLCVPNMGKTASIIAKNFKEFFLMSNKELCKSELQFRFIYCGFGDKKSVIYKNIRNLSKWFMSQVVGIAHMAVIAPWMRTIWRSSSRVLNSDVWRKM